MMLPTPATIMTATSCPYWIISYQGNDKTYKRDLFHNDLRPAPTRAFAKIVFDEITHKQ
jgi:hypothetical protein